MKIVSKIHYKNYSSNDRQSESAEQNNRKRRQRSKNIPQTTKYEAYRYFFEVNVSKESLNQNIVFYLEAITLKRIVV